MKNLTSLYIAKNFLIKFLQIATAFSLLIFFINLLDALDKIKAANSPFYTAILMAFLQIPDFLNDIAPSLILIAAIACFFSISSKSEISIIRMSGFSLWQIIRPAALSAFVIGVLWIVAFGPLSILMTKKFHSLEAKYVKNEMREIVALQKGIWLKQSNVDNPNEELIIQAKKVYKENLEMADVTIWFFNSKNEFYKKLDAKKMLMMDGYLLLKNVTINEGETLNKSLESVTIPTNMKADFVMQKIVNNFQNVKLFSVFELPKLISELRLSGLSQTKLKVNFDYFFWNNYRTYTLHNLKHSQCSRLFRINLNIRFNLGDCHNLSGDWHTSDLSKRKFINLLVILVSKNNSHARKRISPPLHKPN